MPDPPPHRDAAATSQNLFLENYSSSNAGYNGIDVDGVTANISDDPEDLPTIAVSDVTVDEGAGTAGISVTLIGQSVFSASYTISDGSASGGGVDYSVSNDTLTWTANTSGTKTTP